MTGELAKALADARGMMAGTVFKGGTNAHQRYPYVGHEHVMTSGAREALSTHGLALVQTGVEYVGEVPGGKVQALLWRGAFKLLHASGESLELVYLATTQANDKSAFVASTSLDRTAFMRVLALAGSAEWDPEHDVHDRDREQQQPPTSRQPPSQQQQPQQPQQADTPEARERAKVAASLSILASKLRAPTLNTSKALGELKTEASALKPRLTERQIEELAVDMRGAIARVSEAEEAERHLNASAGAAS